MTVEQTAEAESGWSPWGDADGSSHPALQHFQDDRTLDERVADAVARFGGSWPFIPSSGRSSTTPVQSRFYSSGRRVNVGPIRLLPVVHLVVDDARSLEVDDLR